MKEFIMKGVIESVPPELTGLKYDEKEMLAGNYEKVLLTGHSGFQTKTPAIFAMWRYEDAIERHAENKFQPYEIAQILADQQGLDVDFFMDKVREGFAKGWLKFYLPDGTPDDYVKYPDHYSRTYESYLGLSREYSTPEDINAWLELWGAKYSFNVGGKKQAEKKATTQQRLILETIKQLRYIPNELPKQVKGKPWVKSEVKEMLDRKPPFEAPSAFDTAWRSLRGSGEIKEIHSMGKDNS
ncbi:hypothetical protein [Oceanisphaera pacifica]|uniref:Uncharacterized protein n=1 Tax=Oceanisphaera pacifica TaxID=2818389 RepID=A0ABS3NJA5_9GAMM|nr:hypothetical protein [Oceanisphaera pacifica]MBO1520643.1 hypothetical protein [Oceanisphaera pacifica]